MGRLILIGKAGQTKTASEPKICTSTQDRRAQEGAEQHVATGSQHLTRQQKIGRETEFILPKLLLQLVRKRGGKTREVLLGNSFKELECAYPQFRVARVAVAYSSILSVMPCAHQFLHFAQVIFKVSAEYCHCKAAIHCNIHFKSFPMLSALLLEE